MADAEDKPPNVDDDDDEAGESTIAMASPSFDPSTSGMPLPISHPPPGFGAGSGPPPREVPVTAPVPFTPHNAGLAPPVVAAAPAPPPAARPPAAPFATTPQGPAAPPTSLRGRGGRAQTVIGIAPPAPGAKSPPVFGSFPAPTSPSAPVRTPPRPMSPVTAKGDAPARPGTLAEPRPRPRAGGPAPTPPKPVEIGAVDDVPAWDDVSDSHNEDSPTMAKSTQDSLALFGLDEAAGNAARAAARGPGPAGGRPATSPMANPGSALSSGGLRPALDQPEKEQETIALTVGDLDLELIRAAGPEDESTRAVPREELLRGQDAQLIVGDDAAGEDATLAVAPSANEASKNLAAFAETMQSDPNAGPPLGGPFPPPTPEVRPSWGGDPNAGWGMGAPISSPNAPDSNPHLPHPPPSSPNPYMPPSSANPYMQGSNPQMMVAPGQMQVPSSGHLPVGPGSQTNVGQRGFNQQGTPIPYPAHMVHPQPGSPWPMSAPGGKRFKISGQILLLAVVGFVCLAVFITGIVLFATTKL